MKILNRYSGWYGKYKNDIKPKIPYRVVKIENDMGVTIPSLENAREEAHSSKQARYLFFKKYPVLRDYEGAGLQIEVEIDQEALEQRKQIEKLDQQRQEETVQNAWWNKD